jgi:hypothetical protein
MEQANTLPIPEPPSEVVNAYRDAHRALEHILGDPNGFVPESELEWEELYGQFHARGMGWRGRGAAHSRRRPRGWCCESGVVDDAGQRDRGTVDCQRPPRVHGPAADHQRAAPAAGPRRVHRSLQHAPATPVASAESARRARTSTRRNERYARSAPGPPGRPDPRIRPGRMR